MSRRLFAAAALLAVALTTAACAGKSEVAQPSRTIPNPGGSSPSGTVVPKNCVAANGIPPAEGKPTVSIPEGPAPTTLQKNDIKVGDGAEVKTGDKVKMQYVGVSCSTGQQFDASWDRGADPFEFTVGGGEVIKGWDQGIPGMKVGGQRVLVIPPELGYGPKGSPPKIAANETLVFVVDAQGVTPGAGGAPAPVPAGGAVPTTAAPK